MNRLLTSSLLAFCTFCMARPLAASEAHDHAEDERGVEVSASAAGLIGLKTTPVAARRLNATQTILARAVPGAMSVQTIAAPVAGRIRYERVPPAAVRAGERILSITSPDTAAKFGELAALRRRVGELARIGVRNAALDTELAVLSAVYSAMTNGLVALAPERGEFALASPCTGRIDEFLHPNGAIAERGTPVFRLTERGHPALFSLIPVSESTRLEDGLAAVARGERGTIRLDRTRADGLVGVWFDYAANGKPAVVLGETCAFSILTDDRETAVPAIPDKGIFRDGITPSVFVRDDHDCNRFVIKAVELGQSADGWTEVKNLNIGTEIVTRGVHSLRFALPARGESSRVAGHFHADGKFHAGSHDER